MSTTGMSLENSVLGERNQSQKVNALYDSLSAKHPEQGNP